MILDLLQGAKCQIKHSESKQDEIRLCCLFCVERGHPRDTRFLLGINLKTGLGYCFHCNWKSGDVRNTVKELCRVLGIPYGDWINRGARKGQGIEVTRPPKPLKPQPTGLPEGYERFGNKPDLIEHKARAYMNSRQVSIMQIVRHQIGFAGAGKMAWRILFPVVAMDKKIYGCVGRTFAQGGRPKYLNTPNLKLMWGADRPAATAVVVEGVMDALRTERALLAVRNTIAVARLGSSITSLQLSQLKEYEHIIIFPDHDAAGVKGAIHLAEKCHAIHLPVAVAIPACMDDRDPGEMNDEEILTSVDDAKIWGGYT